jgi:hypothetical protein
MMSSTSSSPPERIPLNRIDCEPIKIDPSFSYFFHALFIKHYVYLKLVEP